MLRAGLVKVRPSRREMNGRRVSKNDSPGLGVQVGKSMSRWVIFADPHFLDGTAFLERATLVLRQVTLFQLSSATLLGKEFSSLHSYTFTTNIDAQAPKQLFVAYKSCHTSLLHRFQIFTPVPRVLPCLRPLSWRASFSANTLRLPLLRFSTTTSYSYRHHVLYPNSDSGLKQG